MKKIFDPETNEIIGAYLKYKNDSGPCIYGKTEFVPNEDYKQRILAAISSRESPIRAENDPTKVGWPLKPGYSSVQAYEPWISIGMCHAISRNGNAQRLLQKLSDSVPSVKDSLLEDGFIVEQETFKDSDGNSLTLPRIRSEDFCVAIHKALENEETIQPQCEFFWGLIEERFPIVKETGWWESAVRDERIMLIISSLAINAGTTLFRSILEDSEEYTADALTSSRIKKYKAIGSNFGVDRANWERSCSYVTDGRQIDELMSTI
jgi:hypothetical protein